MRIEPALKLALTLEASPGAYALLMGSGVSRSAGIPTGWEIVIDLIRRYAAIIGEEPEPDPVSWYRLKFGEDPKYDELINKFAATQTERRNLLRSYFEPTLEESEQRIKVPTAAHQAIAALARMGYIRMILTTNFDRLAETALDKEGIVPDVISSDNQLLGAIPYVHSKSYLIKLHGDYLDTRIKNTSEELANYSQEMNNLLDHILDEFGLIVCGWSSEFDIALRDAILRSPNRRFTVFWLLKGEPTEEAKRLINHLRAEVVYIDGADKTFKDLLEKLKSLRELNQTHPISTAVAVSTIKRYIVDPKHRIRLHDLIWEETENVFQELTSDKFETNVPKFTKELFQQRMHEYESLVECLLSMLAALSFYDTGENRNLISTSIERLANKPRLSGKIPLLNLQLYPALLVLYSAGICALSSKRFDILSAILLEPKYEEDFSSEKVPAIDKLHAFAVFDQDAGKIVPRPNAEREYTPANEYIFDVIKPILHNYLPDEKKYEEMFDIFEYLLSLTYRDLLGRSWSPIGRFGWNYRTRGVSGKSPISEFFTTGSKQGDEWGLLKSGFFNGSIDHLNKIIEENDIWLHEATRGWL